MTLGIENFRTVPSISTHRCASRVSCVSITKLLVTAALPHPVARRTSTFFSPMMPLLTGMLCCVLEHQDAYHMLQTTGTDDPSVHQLHIAWLLYSTVFLCRWWIIRLLPGSLWHPCCCLRLWLGWFYRFTLICYMSSSVTLRSTSSLASLVPSCLSLWIYFMLSFLHLEDFCGLLCDCSTVIPNVLLGQSHHFFYWFRPFLLHTCWETVRIWAGQIIHQSLLHTLPYQSIWCKNLLSRATNWNTVSPISGRFSLQSIFSKLLPL